MPRNRIKKTDHGSRDTLLYEQAYDEILKGRSIRAAANRFNICHVSLIRYKRKREANPNEFISMGYNPATKVFTEEQEQSIAKYLVRTADIYYGLTPKELRRLVLDLAIKFDLIGTPLSEITNVSSDSTPVLDPKPSTSKGTKPFIFSPEVVRPLPKAPPRKTTNRGRKKRQTAIYTDTPEKDAIQKEAEEKRKKAKQIKNNLQHPGKSKGIKCDCSQKKKTAAKNDSESSEEEEEWFCVVCMELYSASRPNKKWIQCAQCRLWAHEECTPQESIYVCHNCESDFFISN